MYVIQFFYADIMFTYFIHLFLIGSYLITNQVCICVHNVITHNITYFLNKIKNTI